jgi:carbonic anhydrase/acetyltransferase-like protein (isoleucine patch superfamily)
MPIYALGDLVPEIHPEAFIHPDAVIIGNVIIGAKSSVWPCAVLRGDTGQIRIGHSTSIQDGVVIHCTNEAHTIIGDRVTIGHNVHIEGAIIEDDTLIGSGAVLLHHVLVRTRALVAAGAVLKEKTEVPSQGLAVGVPAKIKEDAVAIGAFDWNVDTYLKNVEWYSKELRRLD